MNPQPPQPQPQQQQQPNIIQVLNTLVTQFQNGVAEFGRFVQQLPNFLQRAGIIGQTTQAAQAAQAVQAGQTGAAQAAQQQQQQQPILTDRSFWTSLGIQHHMHAMSSMARVLLTTPYATDVQKAQSVMDTGVRSGIELAGATIGAVVGGVPGALIGQAVGGGISSIASTIFASENISKKNRAEYVQGAMGDLYNLAAMGADVSPEYHMAAVAMEARKFARQDILKRETASILNKLEDSGDEGRKLRTMLFTTAETMDQALNRMHMARQASLDMSINTSKAGG